MRVHKIKKSMFNFKFKSRKLVVLVFLISTVSLAIGYVSKAQKEQLNVLLEKTSQKEEVKSFLNKDQVISIDKKHIVSKDRKAQVLWEDELIYPATEVVQSGEYFVVLNEKRTSIDIYGVSGYKGEILLVEDIVSFDTDTKGNVITLSLKNDKFTVNEYLNSGELSRTVTQTSEKGVYPISLRINPKGDILAINSIDINGPVPKSLIGVFNLDKDIPEIVQGITERDNLVYDIKFEGNKLVATGDKESHTYTIAF